MNSQTTGEKAKRQYAEWLLASLQKQGVELSVVSGGGLQIKGRMTAGQKESIRFWKQHLIDALSPKCEVCALPMNLINDGGLWFCPFGCQSVEAIQ